MAELVQTTIGHVLDHTAEIYPDQEAVIYMETDLRYTYREFRSICHLTAKGLMSLGLQKGDSIAIWSTNIPEWVITQFASAMIGAVLVTVNTNYRSDELEYLLRQSESTTLVLIDGFCEINYIQVINGICPELSTSKPGELKSKRLPKLKNVIHIGSNTGTGMISWEEMLAKAITVSDKQITDRQGELHPDDVINIQYTSGTTGFPKGVMLTHNNIINNAIQVAECQSLTTKDRVCLPVPFFHCFGCVLGTLACVATGATMVPLIIFNTRKVLEVIEEEKCTALLGVPTMFIAELNYPKLHEFDLSSLRTGIMAGSPCPTEVVKRVIDVMGIRDITIAYGQTEASPVISQTRPSDPMEKRISTVGRVHEHVEVKIVDTTTGEEVPAGTQGELCTRGYHVMAGYYKMPEQTALTIDQDGWLHTGDLAAMDEEGYVKITGRLKDMIIRGGENVYPREIEEFLHSHPKILDVQVFGVPDKRFGEQVAASIKVKENEELSAEDVKQYCQGRIANYKIPQYITIVSDYPMTASGKIQKYRLRESATKQLDLSHS